MKDIKDKGEKRRRRKVPQISDKINPEKYEVKEEEDEEISLIQNKIKGKISKYEKNEKKNKNKVKNKVKKIFLYEDIILEEILSLFLFSSTKEEEESNNSFSTIFFISFLVCGEKDVFL